MRRRKEERRWIKVFAGISALAHMAGVLMWPSYAEFAMATRPGWLWLVFFGGAVIVYGTVWLFLTIINQFG